MQLRGYLGVGVLLAGVGRGTPELQMPVHTELEVITPQRAWVYHLVVLFWIRIQQVLRIQTLCRTRPCLRFFSRDKDREQNQKHRRPKKSWGLFPATIHIRFSRVSSTTGSSECLTLLAVTEIGAEPKYRHFITHSLRGILLSPTAFLHHLGLSGDLSKVSFFCLFLARTLEIKVNWVFLFLPLFKG